MIQIDERRKLLNSTKFMMLLIIITSVNIFSQSVGDAFVKTWAGNKKSAFSFSFDDGLKSQYDYARPVLNLFGFKGTFYIIAGELVDQGQQLIWRYGTWDEFREMANEGHEIASHTMTHPDMTKIPIGNITEPNTVYYELYQSKKLIEQKIPGFNVITFAYPFTNNNYTVDGITDNYYEAARIGGDIPNNAAIPVNGWQNLHAYEEQFNKPRNATSADLDELSDIESSVTNIINSGKWGILFAHEVIPFSQMADALTNNYWYPMSAEWLTAYSQWLKAKSDNDDVWVETVANVTRYIKEREDFNYNIILATNSQIKLDVTDDLDDELYNYPLTVDVVVPSGWLSVQFIQGNNIQTVSSFVNNNVNYARVNIIPDGGEVTLNDMTNPVMLYSFSGNISYDNVSSTPLKNVTVKLINGNGQKFTAVTDANGNYQIDNLDAGTYNLSLDKTDSWGGSDATDALLSVRYYLNLTTLDTLPKLAADVDNNGLVNAADALLMVRRYVNLITKFSISDWVFESQNTAVVITDKNVVKNMRGIAAGDVNRLYVPI